MFAEDNARVWRVIDDWLKTYFPAIVTARADADAINSAG
jgi:hypothetical protein